MSQLRVNEIVSENGSGAPNFPNGATGITITNVDTATYATTAGIATYATTAGIATYADTAGIATNAQGLSGAPDITVGNIISNGDVSIAGTITYEDVTSVDSIGIITARSGIEVQTGGITVTAGGVTVNGGALSVSDGADLDGYKIEEGDIDAVAALDGTFNFNLGDGHILKYTTATVGNYGPNIRISGTTTLDSVTDVGDVVTATLMVASSSHYLDQTDIQVDGSTSDLDIDFVGGSAPSSANGSGFDIYSFTIQKTAATPAYHIIVNSLGVN